MKKRLILLLLGFALCSPACMFIETKTTQNDNIDADIRAEIAPLNKKVFNCLMTNNVAGLKKLMSKILIDSSGKNIDTIVHMTAEYKAKSYKILDEFYTKNAFPGRPVTIVRNKGDLNNYTIKYGALNREMYASIMVSEGLPINFAVLAVYGKYDDVWKLNIISVNDYTILGKTAPEYYADALQDGRKNDTIDAAMKILTASVIGHPGGKHFKYQDDDDMQVFYTGTIANANATYHFPITLTQIKTRPQILGVTPKVITEKPEPGVFPIIKYKSAINIADTVALKAENLEIQKMIGTVFKSITDNNNYIFYDALNLLPDGKASPRYYVFVQKLK